MASSMADARTEILDRLRRVVDEPGRMFRSYEEVRRPEVPMHVTLAEGDSLALAKRFASELEAVKGSYEIVDDLSDVPARVIEQIRSWESESDAMDGKDPRPLQVLGWDPGKLPLPGIRKPLAEAGIEWVVPDDLLDDEDRQRAAAAATGLTGVEAAFASTGTIVLAPAEGKSRAASLLPYRHIVLVPIAAIHPTIESWLASLRSSGQLADLVRDSAQLAFITGPSKSADIELNLTLGVHGPKQVHAVLFDSQRP